MSRPESIADIKHDDRFIRVATFDVDQIITSPMLLKHYNSMLEQVQKLGGFADKNYSGVELHIPKSKKLLEDQLKGDQYHWDELQRYYNLAVVRGPGDTDVPEWRRNSIKEWAKAEGLPDPFDVFAANDDELDAIRQELEENKR